MLLNADLIPIFQKAATLKGRINVCEREPVKASAGVSVAKITLISYMGGRGAGGGNECALSRLSYIWRTVCFC